MLWSKILVREWFIQRRLIPVGHPTWLRAQMYAEIEEDIRAKVSDEMITGEYFMRFAAHESSPVIGPQGLEFMTTLAAEEKRAIQAPVSQEVSLIQSEDEEKKMATDPEPLVLSRKAMRREILSGSHQEPLLEHAESARACPCPKLSCTIL